MKMLHRSISTSLLFIAFLCVDGNVNAQDKNRDISLQVLNKKGRPKDKIFVQSLKTKEGGFTDKSGQFVFKGMADNDTISASVPRFGNFFIPVAGMDMIVVTMRSNSYSYIDYRGEVRIVNKDKIAPTDILDVQEMIKRRSYSSLADLLQGQVAGLNVLSTPVGTQVRIRGITSINMSNEPLVVVDGAYMTFSEANQRVYVNNIVSIEILKDGAGWGVQGATGVIIIKTK